MDGSVSRGLAGVSRTDVVGVGAAELGSSGVGAGAESDVLHANTTTKKTNIRITRLRAVCFIRLSYKTPVNMEVPVKLIDLSQLIIPHWHVCFYLNIQTLKRSNGDAQPFGH